jgi:ADP-ribose pyrophosphatase YjhB (NUDIX family)
MTHRKQPLSSQEFEAIYSRVPRVTVEVVITSVQGVVLALRQEPSWHGLWHIPGGTILYKETVQETVARIAHEELGVRVSVGEILGYIEYPSEEKERGFGWSVGLAFHCQLASSVDQERWEKEKIQFFTELPDNMLEEQRAVLELALQKQSQR